VLRDAGAAILAQDEASSVVWGMPGTAVRLGAAMHVLPLQHIAVQVLNLAAAAAAA
jgi:two-component system chemotaxis response regulator CheB